MVENLKYLVQKRAALSDRQGCFVTADESKCTQQVQDDSRLDAMRVSYNTKRPSALGDNLKKISDAQMNASITLADSVKLIMNGERPSNWFEQYEVIDRFLDVIKRPAIDPNPDKYDQR